MTRIRLHVCHKLHHLRVVYLAPLNWNVFIGVFCRRSWKMFFCSLLIFKCILILQNSNIARKYRSKYGTIRATSAPRNSWKTYSVWNPENNSQLCEGHQLCLVAHQIADAWCHEKLILLQLILAKHWTVFQFPWDENRSKYRCGRIHLCFQTRNMFSK